MLSSISHNLPWLLEPISAASPEVKAALIGSAGTLLLAGVALWQIGRQAHNAIEQNKQNESLKLKLQIYEHALDVFNKCSAAETAYSSFLQKILMDLDFYKSTRELGMTPRPIDARTPELIQLNHNMTTQTIKIIRLVEQWHIIDPRLYLFQTAINAANYDVKLAYGPFFELAHKILPVSVSGAQDKTTVFPWIPPGGELEATFKSLLMELSSKLDIVACYIMDFQNEMQGLLLADLFKYPVRVRAPLDPSYKVLKLTDYNELMKYFEKESPWGKYTARLNEETRARYAGQ